MAWLSRKAEMGPYYNPRMSSVCHATNMPTRAPTFANVQQPQDRGRVVGNNSNNNNVLAMACCRDRGNAQQNFIVRVQAKKMHGQTLRHRGA